MFLDVVLWALVLLPALVALTWIDIRTMRLPDMITLPLIGVGVVQSWYFAGAGYDYPASDRRRRCAVVVLRW